VGKVTYTAKGKTIMTRPYSNQVKGLVSSVMDMYQAHPSLNIYLQFSERSKTAGIYKLARNKESGEFELRRTEIHKVIEPCLILG